MKFDSAPSSMQKKLMLLMFFSVFAFQLCHAAEIDSVTPRKLKLDNSIKILTKLLINVSRRESEKPMSNRIILKI